jgi:hypothetical protein
MTGFTLDEANDTYMYALSYLTEIAKYHLVLRDTCQQGLKWGVRYLQSIHGWKYYHSLIVNTTGDGSL